MEICKHSTFSYGLNTKETSNVCTLFRYIASSNYSWFFITVVLESRYVASL